MEISAVFLTLIPVTIGLVQVAKESGLNSRFAPLVALFVAIGGTALLNHLDILQGVMVALTAMGLFSGTKTTVAK